MIDHTKLFFIQRLCPGVRRGDGCPPDGLFLGGEGSLRAASDAEPGLVGLRTPKDGALSLVKTRPPSFSCGGMGLPLTPPGELGPCGWAVWGLRGLATPEAALLVVTRPAGPPLGPGVLSCPAPGESGISPSPTAPNRPSSFTSLFLRSFCVASRKCCVRYSR